MSDETPPLPPSEEGMEYAETESRRALRALCIEAFEHAGWSVTVSDGAMMLGALPVFCDVLDGERIRLYAHVSDDELGAEDILEINEGAPFSCILRPYEATGDDEQAGTTMAVGAFNDLRIPAAVIDIEALAQWLDAQASEVAGMVTVLNGVAGGPEGSA